MKPPAAATVKIEPPALDNVQLILARREELARNKAKFQLTETDAKLLSTHATEIHFEDGQTIIEEGQDVDAVYRIKSGQVAVFRNGAHFNDIGKGWFIGDPMLLYDTPAYTIKKTMKATGHVVLDKLNLPFIQQLFQVDLVLKAKVMRYLTAKFSVIFAHVVNNIDPHYNKYTHSSSGSNTPTSSTGSPSISPSTSSSDLLNPETAKVLTAEFSSTNDLFTADLPSSDSVSSITSSSSSSSSTSSTSSSSTTSSSSSVSTNTPSSPVLSSPSSPSVKHNNFKEDLITRERPAASRREARKKEHAAYKSYPLMTTNGGVQTLQIKAKRLSIVSKCFGFSFKTSIDFTKIMNLTKVGENAVTILYQPRKVANVFFKNYYDREEFFGLVNSLTSHAPAENKRLSGQSIGIAHNPDLTYDETPLCQGDASGDYECESVQYKQIFKKGEHVLDEGDLYQRIYICTKGWCEAWRDGKKICTMEEGDIQGIQTLLHLRPVPITLIAASDEVEIMVIPGYKLNALIDTDAGRAAAIYKDCAIALDRKISQVVGYLPNHKRIAREASMRKRAESSSSEISNSDSTESADSGIFSH